MSLEYQYLSELAYDLTHARTPADVLVACTQFRGDLDKYKAVVTLDEYREFDQIKRLKKVIDSNKEFLSFYFDSFSLYFTEKKMLSEMITNKTTYFRVDYSIAFDTNFASYIEKFVEGKGMGDASNSVYSLIDMLIRFDFNYDYNFYLTENMKQIYNHRYEINKDSEEAIIHNIESLELFKSINTKNYIEKGIVEYTISRNEARKYARSLLDLVFNNKEMLGYNKDVLRLQRNILLSIIGMIKIQYKSKCNARNKMKDYFNYINEVVGVYLDREAIIAFEYFDKNPKTSIFNKIARNMKQERLFDRLDNIAWDFMIPRFLERQFAIGGEGDFYLPFFISLDRGLHNMLDLHKIKGLINKKGTLITVPIPKYESREYFISKGLGDVYECHLDTKSKRQSMFNRSEREEKETLENQINELKEILF